MPKQKTKKKSYMGNPYYGSNRSARIYTSLKSATQALKKKGKSGVVDSVGKGMYCIKIKGQKHYSK